MKDTSQEVRDIRDAFRNRTSNIASMLGKTPDERRREAELERIRQAEQEREQKVLAAMDRLGFDRSSETTAQKSWTRFFEEFPSYAYAQKELDRLRAYITDPDGDLDSAQRTRTEDALTVYDELARQHAARKAQEAANRPKPANSDIITIEPNESPRTELTQYAEA